MHLEHKLESMPRRIASLAAITSSNARNAAERTVTRVTPRRRSQSCMGPCGNIHANEGGCHKSYFLNTWVDFLNKYASDFTLHCPPLLWNELLVLAAMYFPSSKRYAACQLKRAHDGTENIWYDCWAAAIQKYPRKPIIGKHTSPSHPPGHPCSQRVRSELVIQIRSASLPCGTAYTGYVVPFAVTVVPVMISLSPVESRKRQTHSLPLVHALDTGFEP